MAAVKKLHLHMVSDATGETVHSVVRACLVQFEGIDVAEHMWPLVRTKGQLEKVLASIGEEPGLVLYTMVDKSLHTALINGLRKLKVPHISVLDPIMGALANYLGLQSRNLPGRQHELDAEYFSRIDAMQFVLTHDDGQATWDLDHADVVLVGVSRTSKTPTCIYLANRGIKAANVPVVPGVALPSELLEARHPLIIGLTKDPVRLVQLRRNRLRTLNESEDTDYTDLDTVKRELASARRLFTEHGWHVLDVTRRSIEETAAAIMQLYADRRKHPL
ncbi:MAG TPA: pyruvate, water dikinase regulatory protein [Alphaproteobacteria bacterium]|nr:pyruvate, water dikinase regulatory protein [Alphaproteobacteria bacterium]